MVTGQWSGCNGIPTSTMVLRLPGCGSVHIENSLYPSSRKKPLTVFCCNHRNIWNILTIFSLLFWSIAIFKKFESLKYYRNIGSRADPAGGTDEDYIPVGAIMVSPNIMQYIDLTSGLKVFQVSDTSVLPLNPIRTKDRMPLWFFPLKSTLHPSSEHLLTHTL